MAKNIEMQYFNGSSYEIVYPKTDTTNILHNGETLSSFLDNIQDNIEIDAAPMYTYGTEDLQAGVTPLETGKLHFVYE